MGVIKMTKVFEIMNCGCTSSVSNARSIVTGKDQFEFLQCTCKTLKDGEMKLENYPLIVMRVK